MSHKDKYFIKEKNKFKKGRNKEYEDNASIFITNNNINNKEK